MDGQTLDRWMNRQASRQIAILVCNLFFFFIERLNATSYKHYDNLLTERQDTYPISSPLSRYNSSILYHS